MSIIIILSMLPSVYRCIVNKTVHQITGEQKQAHAGIRKRFTLANSKVKIVHQCMMLTSYVWASLQGVYTALDNRAKKKMVCLPKQGNEKEGRSVDIFYFFIFYFFREEKTL